MGDYGTPYCTPEFASVRENDVRRTNNFPQNCSKRVAQPYVSCVNTFLSCLMVKKCSTKCSYLKILRGLYTQRIKDRNRPIVGHSVLKL